MRAMCHVPQYYGSGCLYEWVRSRFLVRWWTGRLVYPHTPTKNSNIDKQVIRDILEWGAEALPPLPEEAREAYPYFAFLPNLQVRTLLFCI